MKQVIVIRKDLNMRKGKMIAQGAHASSEVCMVLADISWNSAMHDVGAKHDRWVHWFRQWETQHAYTKICVSVDSEEELLLLRDKAVEAGIINSTVRDIGKTEFNGIPTYTALAIGPAPADILDPITGHLKLL